MSPTERSLKHLRDEGFLVCIVEKVIPHCFLRKDAFGFGDLLACNCDRTSRYFGVWLIQTTSGSNHAARVKKAMALREMTTWLRSGGRFAVLSWRKLKQGWTPRFEEELLSPNQQ